MNWDRRQHMANVAIEDERYFLAQTVSDHEPQSTAIQEVDDKRKTSDMPHKHERERERELTSEALPKTTLKNTSQQNI